MEQEANISILKKSIENNIEKIEKKIQSKTEE